MSEQTWGECVAAPEGGNVLPPGLRAEWWICVHPYRDCERTITLSADPHVRRLILACAVEHAMIATCYHPR